MEQNENPYLEDRLKQFQEWIRESPGVRSVGSRQENPAVQINPAIQGGEIRESATMDSARETDASAIVTGRHGKEVGIIR